MKKFILLLIMLVASVSAFSQTESKSTELESIEIPAGTPVYQGTTRTGNPKYFITIVSGDVTKNITITESQAKHIKSGDEPCVLVKRQNNETKRITYSVRLKNGRSSTSAPDIALTKNIFQTK